ncbi:MAG: UDP-N-acetylglucosamine 2-epimerase (hydrolyzing) [Bacteroidia bacterium]|nr:UDP-N-acetylglucosamine 2-epimerase (hydrolyzing) [Bacteroidia bacterium]
MSKNKRLLFITGTRADFGKLKPLIKKVESEGEFKVNIFATGMHTLSLYGYTVREIYNAGFQNVHVFMNQIVGEPMELILANTISGLARYVREIHPDMIIVHGDRIEALAGAVVGALNNILVSHVEGGEVSGTIDELIRHSISKMSHLHFVSTEEAQGRLLQMGEKPESIFTIGSPDIDVMLSEELPSLEEVRKRYNIQYENYGILLFHPVTTEVHDMFRQAQEVVEAVVESGFNFVVIFPNNDEGSQEILLSYEKLKDKGCFRLFPSLRFEYFLTLLKNARMILGNSSAGIREAPVYGVPVVNVGSRQDRRFEHKSIINVPCNSRALLPAIRDAWNTPQREPILHFGKGDSSERFFQALRSSKVWETPKQKVFLDFEKRMDDGFF